jgi:uncharacterized protein
LFFYNINSSDKQFRIPVIMKINISDIVEEGVKCHLSEDMREESLFRSSGPVNAHIELSRRGEEIRVEGEITGSLSLQCSRCLKDFNVDIMFDFDSVYHPCSTVARGEGHEIPAEEAEIGFYQGEEIDIGYVVKEQLILNIPMKPLCEIECKGLCPVCGKDLNKESCGCKKEKIDKRFEPLKSILSNRKEH